MKKTLISSLIAAVCSSGFAAPVVVQPGGTVGYMYFPSQAAASGGSTATTSVGGVTLVKNTTLPGKSNTDYIITHSGTQCGSGCINFNWNTGAGFVTLTASRPTIWTSSADVILTGCESTLSCQVWVSTNSTLTIKTFPSCFEGDIATLGTTTCSTSNTLSANNVYSTGGGILGKYAGLNGGAKIVSDISDISTNTTWGCSGVLTTAVSTTNGFANTATIRAATCTSDPNKVSNLCYNKSPAGAWFLPSTNELSLLFTHRAAIGGFSALTYWTSTDSSLFTAVQLSFNTGATEVQSKFFLNKARCTRSF